MLSRLREHLGTAGLIVAIVALTVALAGGAIAANGGAGDGKATASAKAKKGPRGPKGPKGPKGDTGPAGPAGPAGPQGAKGDTGAAGANGAAGAKGATGNQGNQGVKGATGATGVTGPTGQTGFTKTLPPGETETGTWSISSSSMGFMDSTDAISFPIPLAAPGTAFAFNEKQTVEEEFTEECPGSLAEPKAEPGFLCVYTQYENFTNALGEILEARSPGGDFGAYGTSGAILHGAFLEGSLEEEKVAVIESYGTWAVTAPPAGP